ncbi:transporter substrate-binding domain-containing protein [Candidatus Acetothermia bacterium]|nr:transporter substrate-binding domain-containing protein [Candidatus Acetothermia bacterium]
MKNLIRWSLALAVIFTALGVGSQIPQAQPSGTFSVCSEIAFAPFEYEDKNKQNVGFDLDLIRIIAILRGFKVDIQNLAFDSIIPAVQSGKCDLGVSSFTITAERAKVVDFSDPYFDANQAVLVNAQSGLNAITAFKKGNKIGAQEGTTGADYIDALIKAGIEVQLKLYKTYPDAEKDLANKNIQAVLEDEPVARATAKASKGVLKVAGIVVTDEQYGMLAAKGDPKKLIAAVNAALKDIRRAGIYANLYEAYFGADVNLDRTGDCYKDLKPYLDRGTLAGAQAYAENLSLCMAGQQYKKP